MEGRAQTSLQAFLFTDIVGSTALKREKGDIEGAEVIAAHDACFRDAVGQFRGVEQNNPGDGFFATFPVPSAALNCALAFQAAIADLEIEVRVGIHMGEAVHVPGAGDHEKLLGLAVDTAGRVMSLALPNQILITRHAFDSARQQVRHGPADERVVWRAHGAYHFKGLDEPLEIHEAGIKGCAPLQPPPDSEKARRAIAPGDEETLGWRPGVGLGIPGRSGWNLERELGSGGFGEVWLARSERTKEQRAFKFCFRADRLRTLQRELTLFRLLKETLGERNDIARLYDVRLDEAPYFLEMEYTPDGSLDRWGPEDDRIGKMSIADRAEFVAEVAEALGAAHSVGVLHKDVKPSNILVRKDREDRPHARLTDFGIGQLLDTADLEGAMISGAGFTEPGMLSELGSRTGTRVYMAPELSAGKTASIASDIYALGVLLYQMICGDLTRPLAQGWERDIPDRLLIEDIAGCIAGKPEERLASGGLVAQRLRSLDERREHHAEEERRVALEARRARRLRVATVASVLLLLVAISGFVVAGMLDSRRREAEDARAESAKERDAKANALAAVLRLADAKVVRDLLTEYDDLWPIDPKRAPAMKRWLERSEKLLRNRAGHDEELDNVRKRADPYTEEQRALDHATQIDFLKTLRASQEKDAAPPEDAEERKAWEERRAAVKRQAAELEATIAKRGSWSFPAESDAWRNQVLGDLLADLDRLQSVQDKMRARHQAALTLRSRSIDAHRARWDETIQQVAAEPRYGGLKLVPQLGLVPLGPDPESGLFEFAHIESGAVPKRDPATRRLQLTDDFAVVLVLIPGGTFTMGAQATDPQGSNYDPDSREEEQPVHTVTLSPYFLSKYECTQAQWKKMTSEHPSRYGQGKPRDDGLTMRHPVETVSWNECVQWLLRYNLELPTEAGWENACRAGTDTPWSSGREVKSLQGFANIADAFVKANGGPEGWQYTEEINDGFVLHAPVGSLRPNAFGLHDMHGNVNELCMDTYSRYPAAPVTDPLAWGKPQSSRVYRGGTWNLIASVARSATRNSVRPSIRDMYLGVRPAMTLATE